MPRTTRAAARAQESDSAPQVFEDPDIASSRSSEELSPTNQHSSRPIFGELAGNKIPTPAPEVITITVDPMPVKKGKKVRTGGKKDKIQLHSQTTNDISTCTEVLEDENQSDSSDAAEAAVQELRKDEPLSEMFQVPMDNARAKSPISAAAREATSTLLHSPSKDAIAVQGLPPITLKFEPSLHRDQNSEDLEEDSFAENIIARSPIKPVCWPEEPKEDSFVEAIISRSPTKITPRIEDSVAEMDALDDAIEQVAEILPVLEEQDLASHTVIQNAQPSAPAPKPERKTALTTNLTTKPTTRPARARPSPATASVRASKAPTTKASTVRNPTKPTVRPSILPAKPRIVSADNSDASKASLSFSASPAKPCVTQKRTSKVGVTSLSTSKPGFVPAKSSKPPTKSTFMLPGEAVAAKLKAQREERLRREEEASAAAESKKKTSKPTTKAKPRLSTMAAPTVKPRENKTSQARQSLMQAKEKQFESGENKENVKPGRTGGTISKSPPSKPRELIVSKREPTAPSGPKTAVPANSPIRRKDTAVAPRVSNIVRKSVVPSGSEGATKPTAKGKEVFGRNKFERDDAEKTRKEKEEAAKKARLEAAERGRIASREWAERQKKKVEAAKRQVTTATQAESDDGVAVPVSAGE